MSATAWLIIVTLLIAALGTYKMLARETGFKIFAPPEGEKRFEWLSKLFASSKQKDEKSGLDTNERLWFLLVILFMATITLHYLLPDNASRFRTVGLTVIVIFHVVVIWLFLVEKKVHTATKLLVGGWFIFSVIGFFLPHYVYREWEAVKTATKEFDEGHGKTPASQATQQGGIPASIIAVKEKPSEWILLPENKNVASTCNGDGVIYIRHSKSPPEGFGPYPCTPNGVAIDFGKLNGGNRLINAEVRYQSAGEPFVVNFRECPTSTSCVMRES